MSHQAEVAIATQTGTKTTKRKGVRGSPRLTLLAAALIALLTRKGSVPADSAAVHI